MSSLEVAVTLICELRDRITIVLRRKVDESRRESKGVEERRCVSDQRSSIPSTPFDLFEPCFSGQSRPDFLDSLRLARRRESLVESFPPKLPNKLRPRR